MMNHLITKIMKVLATTELSLSELLLKMRRPNKITHSNNISSKDHNRMKYANRINFILHRLKKKGIIHTHETRNTFKPTIIRSTKSINGEIILNIPDIDYTNSPNYDIDCILLNAVEYLSLPDYSADRAKYMLAKHWNGTGQKQNFNKIPYELVGLACMMYCCDTDLPEDNTINFKEIIQMIYSNTDKRMRQLNRAYRKISELHECNTGETVKVLTLAEKLALMKGYTLRHKNAHKE